MTPATRLKKISLICIPSQQQFGICSWTKCLCGSFLFFLPSSNLLTLYYSMSSHFILTLNRGLQKDYVIPRKFGGPWIGCRRFLWIWYLWQFFSVCIHTKLILRIIVKTHVSIIRVMHGKLRWSKIRWKQGKREKRVLLFFIPVKWVS